MNIVKTLFATPGNWEPSFFCNIGITDRGVAIDAITSAKTGGCYFATVGSATYTESTSAVIVRVSNTGTFMWKTKHTITSGNSRAYGIRESADGTKLFVSIQNNTTVPFSANNAYLVMCLDASNGSVLYSSSVGKYSSTNSYPKGIVVDSAGDVRSLGMMTGYFPYMPKWSGTNLSATNNDKYSVTIGDAYSGANDSAGNLVVVGMSKNETGGAPTTREKILLLRFSGATSTLLTQHVYDTGVDGIYGYSMAVDSSNNIFVAGAGIYSASWCPFIVKFDTSQNVSFAKFITHASGVNSRAAGVVTDSSGNVFVAMDSWGGDNKKVAILKFDNSGNFISGYSIATSDASVVSGGVIGNVNNSYPNGLSIANDVIAMPMRFDNGTTQRDYVMVLNVSSNKTNFMPTGPYTVGAASLTVASIGSITTSAISLTKYTATSGMGTASVSSAAYTPTTGSASTCSATATQLSV